MVNVCLDGFLLSRTQITVFGELCRRSDLVIGSACELCDYCVNMLPVLLDTWQVKTVLSFYVNFLAVWMNHNSI